VLTLTTKRTQSPGYTGLWTSATNGYYRLYVSGAGWIGTLFGIRSQLPQLLTVKDKQQTQNESWRFCAVKICSHA